MSIASSASKEIKYFLREYKCFGTTVLLSYSNPQMYLFLFSHPYHGIVTLHGMTCIVGKTFFIVTNTRLKGPLLIDSWYCFYFFKRYEVFFIFKDKNNEHNAIFNWVHKQQTMNMNVQRIDWKNETNVQNCLNLILFSKQNKENIVLFLVIICDLRCKKSKIYSLCESGLFG